MNTTHPASLVRASALPCRASGSIATTLLVALSCALAACEPRSVDVSDASDLAAPAAASPSHARGHAAHVGAYFGDEYADAQQSLQALPQEPMAPTF